MCVLFCMKRTKSLRKLVLIRSFYKYITPTLSSPVTSLVSRNVTRVGVATRAVSTHAHALAATMPRVIECQLHGAVTFYRERRVIVSLNHSISRECGKIFQNGFTIEANLGFQCPLNHLTSKRNVYMPFKERQLNSEFELRL